ncbi:MAG: hypothetical protein ACLU9S_23425 [Oscillospiraceae bacterium]
MTRTILLKRLRAFTEEVTADLIMPTRLQKGDTEQIFRPAKVYLMRLPDGTSATKKAPMCCTRSLPAWINSRKDSV